MYILYYIILYYIANDVIMQALIMRQLLLRKGEGRNDVLGLAMALRSTRYGSLHPLTLYYLFFDMTYALYHFLNYVAKVGKLNKNVIKSIYHISE